MGLVVLLLCGLALLWAGCVVGVAWMLTHPPRRTYASAVARNRPGDPGELDRPRKFESWTFRSRGMDLPVWEIEGDRAEGPVVVLTHGWGDSRIGALARVNAVAPAASRIIAWDMAGHGEAPGVCALGMREVEDLKALIERCAAGRGVVLYGWSLGAGVSIAAAAGDARVIGVVAESPYRLAATPARGVLAARGLPHRTTLGPALWVVRLVVGGVRDGEFDRAVWASRLMCPLLVMHGSEDVVCPVEDGREIAEAGRGRMEVVEGRGHNDLWVDGGSEGVVGEWVLGVDQQFASRRCSNLFVERWKRLESDEKRHEVVSAGLIVERMNPRDARHFGILLVSDMDPTHQGLAAAQLLSEVGDRELLPWVETQVTRHGHVPFWGQLASACGIAWQDLERWISLGRPMSLIALDCLYSIGDFEPGRILPSVARSRKRLRGPIDEALAIRVLEGVAEQDSVHRVRSQVAAIIAGWSLIVEENRPSNGGP